jgi:hypothetical protein
LYYASDRFEIRPEYQEMLSELAERLKVDTTTWVEISGHADLTGSKKYNENLSLKRTETVLKFFYQEKINPERIKGYHYGSGKPIASNDTKTGRKKNRRVEVHLFKKGEAMPANRQPSVSAEKSSGPEYVVEPRVEIDIHYNKEKFVYLVNGHRNVLHTVRDAEVVFDTNCFALPVKSGLYGNQGKLRLDFSEMDKKGEFLLGEVGLRTPQNGALQASYIFCLDSVNAQGLAHIKKGREVEFLIPSGYVSEGSKIYYSPDHIRTRWVDYSKPQFNSLHNEFVMYIKDEGCYAIAKPQVIDLPTNMSVTYTRKPKELKNKRPEFFFVYKEENTVIAADSADGEHVFFNNLKSGAHGTVVGMFKGETGNCYFASVDVTIKHHGNKTYHPHAHLKLKPVGYFEMDKLILGVQSEQK